MAEVTTAVVLLSGGMDSVALLHWARRRYDCVRAVSFFYGQPNAAEELAAAKAVCKRWAVRWLKLYMGQSIGGAAGICAPTAGVDAAGVSRANMPLRNGMMLMAAAAQAMRWWNDGRSVDLLIGCVYEDKEAFPDCSFAFLRRAEACIGVGLGAAAHVRVVGPWTGTPKHELFYELTDEELQDVRRSVSCYSGDQCGRCDACKQRLEAFRRMWGTRGASLCWLGSEERESDRLSFEAALRAGALHGGLTTMERTKIGATNAPSTREPLCKTCELSQTCEKSPTSTCYQTRSAKRPKQSVKPSSG